MKILVAGSTGLVGKTLITDFLQEHEVIAITSCSWRKSVMSVLPTSPVEPATNIFINLIELFGSFIL